MVYEQNREHPPGTDGLPGRRIQLVEVLVFLFLILPAMMASFSLSARGGADFRLLAFSVILRNLELLALVIFFVWRNGEGVRRIGLTSAGFSREVLIGLLLFLPILGVVILLETLLRRLGFSGPSGQVQQMMAPAGWEEYLLALVLIVVVAVSEETIFRGYLIERFDTLLGSRVGAALLASLIFAVGHGYEGTAGVITVGVLGLIWAFLYLWRRSLVAPMVIHFLQNYVGIVLAPAGGG